MDESQPYSWRVFIRTATFLLGVAIGVGPALADTWPQIVAAAKQEGKIVLYGPSGGHVREALVNGFQEKFPDLRVDYTGGTNTQIMPKIINEAKAGLRIADLSIGGSASPVSELLPRNLLADIRPFLVGPESSDASKWKGGRHEFADDAARHVLIPSTLGMPVFAYNSKLFDPSGVRSWKDLLDPQWKGKITIWDPRAPGAGQAMAAFAYNTAELGPDYLRKLFKQEVTFAAAADQRQAFEWIVSGRKVMYLGPATNIAQGLIQKGLPISYYTAARVKEGSWLTSGAGSIAVVRDPPHPNALKVYLDWLLSKEGQLAMNRALSQVSLRQDVPADYIDTALVPQPGVRYITDYKEAYHRKKTTEVADFVTAEIGKLGK